MWCIGRFNKNMPTLRNVSPLFKVCPLLLLCMCVSQVARVLPESMPTRNRVGVAKQNCEVSSPHPNLVGNQRVYTQFLYGLWPDRWIQNTSYPTSSPFPKLKLKSRSCRPTGLWQNRPKPLASNFAKYVAGGTGCTIQFKTIVQIKLKTRVGSTPARYLIN